MAAVVGWGAHNTVAPQDCTAARTDGTYTCTSKGKTETLRTVGNTVYDSNGGSMAFDPRTGDITIKYKDGYTTVLLMKDTAHWVATDGSSITSHGGLIGDAGTSADIDEAHIKAKY